MSLLTSKFDVLKGWPREGAIDQVFTADNGGTAMAAGDIVTLTATGVAWADTNTTAKPVLVVVEGDDDFSGSFVGKVNCIRSNAVLKVSNYTSASFTVGAPVTYDPTGAGTGKWDLATSGMQVIGEVWEDNRAVDGTLTVYFHGSRTLLP